MIFKFTLVLDNPPNSTLQNLMMSVPRSSRYSVSKYLVIPFRRSFNPKRTMWERMVFYFFTLGKPDDVLFIKCEILHLAISLAISYFLGGGKISFPPTHHPSLFCQWTESLLEKSNVVLDRIKAEDISTDRTFGCHQERKCGAEKNLLFIG